VPTLDEQLIALCEEHDLANISISMSRHDFGDHRCFQQVAVQWHDDSKEHGRGIATSDHGTPIREGIVQAVERMNVKRRATAVVPELAAA
jgi:hypothetical protein